MSDLSQQLYGWAHKEMKYWSKMDNKTSLTPDALKKICKGRNAEIWKYVIRHVASTKTVRQVKGNLKIKNTEKRLNKNYGQNDDFVFGLQSVKTQHNDQIQRLLVNKLNIQHLQKSITQTKSIVSETEEKIAELKKKWKEMQHKYILLDKYYMSVDDKIRQHQQIDDDLYKKILNLREKMSCSYSKCKSEENQVYEHENPPMTIQSAIERIEKLLFDIINKKTETELKDTICLQKLMDEIKCQAADNIPNHIISKLVNLSIENITFLTSKIKENEDYQKDPSYSEICKNNHQFRIQELLKSERLVHIKKYLECEQYYVDCLKFEQQATALEVALESELNRNFLERSEDLELAKKILRMEAELNGYNESFEKLHNIITELEKDSCNLAEKEQNLITKYEKTQNFHKIVDKEKNIICDLLAQNLQMAVKIFSHQNQVQSVAESVRNGHNFQTDNFNQYLQNWIIEEIEHFYNMPISILFATPLDRFKLRGTEEMNYIANLFGFQKYLAPERLLTVAANVLISNTQNKLFANNIQQIMDVINKRSVMTSNEDIKEITARIEEEEKKQKDICQLKVKKYLEYVEKGIKQTEDIKEMTHMWWEQPSQLISLDMKVHERSLCHWLKLWSFAICKLDEQTKHKK